MNRRAFLLSSGISTLVTRGEEPQRMVLDADTANEIDDLFAIARSLKEPAFALRGLSSAQWHTRLSPANTVELSQRINEDLLRITGRQDTPAPMGAEMIMGKPWGGDEPRDSPAARLMIREALATEQRLIIASIGAATNVASALKLEPRLIPRARCYLMAAHFDGSTGIWNKDEFNVRNDLNAFNYLLNLEGLDLHIMTATVSRKLVFQRKSTMERLAGLGGALGGILSARWHSHAP